MMSKKNKFAVFILSHGRAENVITVQTLRNCGYTGDIYIIIDDEDKQGDLYKKIYGDKVIVFSKKEMDGTFDIGDNFNDRRVVVYARNKCHDIAKSLGLDYFLELDDDYNDFCYRYEENGALRKINVKSFDKLVEKCIDFLEVSNAHAIAFAQGGDYIGGVGSTAWQQKLLRKVMNTFFCKTDRPFQFYGRINEDTTMYTVLGQRGYIFFTLGDVMVNQIQTQANAGGLTDIYLDKGTYYKSFCSVMFSPSCVKVSSMGNVYRRIHHRVKWNNCCPKIISERYKKK
jgi:hypothetical protein